MDIILSVVSKVAEYMVAPVGRQFGYIMFYKSNLERLKTEVPKLEETKDTVQHSVDAAISKGEEIENIVQSWLEKVDATVAEAKKFCDNEDHGKVRCSSWHFPNLWTRHQLSRKTKMMTQEISEVLAEGKFDNVSYRASSQVTVTTSARGYEALDSRTSTLNEIKQALKDPNIDMIGVYGMGGVGKTTLVNELAWQAQQDGSFGAVVMATITNSPDVRRIQGQLADGLGLKYDEETEKGRAGRLRQRISKEKNILVILDDIWSKLDLTEVGIPFGDNHKGCKLLLTSRYLNVLNSEMGTQKDFRLEVLSEEDSWNLFEKMAGDAVKDFNIKPIAVKVARCCAGLPLLIVTVAKALSKKDVYTWKDSMNQLERFDHEGLRKKVYSTLELSYNYLESDELKSLFLFIGSFGQEYIHIGELFDCCWGMGLYKHVETLIDGRNRLYKLINDLRASSLLLESEREWVRIHSVVCDVAKSIASRTQPTFTLPRDTEIKHWPKIDQLEKYHHIIMPSFHIDGLPENLECPELKFLALGNRIGYLKVPDYFFSGMKKLKVLGLFGWMLTPSLPQSLRLLTNLRTLYLLQCRLEDISIVAELKSLEILRLERSEIEEIPIEIGHLTHLRTLNLTNCTGLRVIPANLISSLTCLEELYMGNCFIQWEVEESKDKSNNASLGELRNLSQLTTLDIMIQDASILPRDLQVFAKLDRYNIFIGNMWKWSLQWSGGASESSRTLKLEESSSTNIFLDHGVKLLLTTVEDLSIAELKCVRSVLYELNGEGFPQLKHLHIQKSAELVYIINSIEWVRPHLAFPNLETLVLHNLNNLEEICHGPLPTQSFNKLKVIEVKGCDKLKNLLLCSHARYLSQLLEMKISECKFMKEIIAEEKLEDEKDFAKITFPKLHSLTLKCLPMLLSFCTVPLTTDMESRNSVTEYNEKQSVPLALIDEKVAMPNLETMKLSSINACKIWDDKLSTHSYIQNLTSLTVDRCGSITFLFSSSVARALVKLNYLEITNCQMLEKIFVLEEKLGILPSSLKPLSSEQVIFPNLETLVISHMDNLKSLWHNLLAPNSFCKLIKMKISYCKKLLNVFPCYVLNKLQNLVTLVVIDCEALEVVFEVKELNTVAASQQGLATHLRTLILETLPMLKHIWSEDPHGSLRFQNLSEVRAIYCKSLDHVFPISVAEELLQLQVLVISGCEIENIVEKSDSRELKRVYLETLIVYDSPRLKNIVPSSVLFQTLEELSVGWCAGVVNIITSSTATSLLKLRKLQIYHCGMIEEIVASENDSDAGEIAFMKLEKLELEYLPRLTSFCKGNYSFKFPSLQEICARECPMMETFSYGNLTTPSLRIVQLGGDEGRWDSDLNTTVRIFFTEKVAMPNLEIMKLSSINTSMIWDDKLSAHSCIQNLTSLTVNSCGSLTCLFSFSVARALVKLNYLEINNCQMLETIFVQEEKLGNLTSSFKPLYSEQVTFPNLETLIISHMDNLKSLWHNLLAPNSFCKLIKMKISYCKKLLNVFPCYVLNKLQNLETLTVAYCEALGVLIASENDGDAAEIVFMKLEKLELEYLPRLTSFCKGNYSFKFPSLQELCVRECPMMETFSHGNLTTPSLRIVRLGGDEGHWDGDLNSTLRILFTKKNSKEDLSLSSKSEG